MESALLALFMVSACFVTVVVEHPFSAVRQAVPSAFFRQALSGIAMALTLLGLIHSSWGKRSAHT